MNYFTTIHFRSQKRDHQSHRLLDLDNPKINF